MDKLPICRKSTELVNPSYIFAPYIPMQTTDISVEYTGKKTMRKSKINKIFQLGLDVKCESPTSIVSRLTKKVINNKFYQTVEIKNPLY